MIYTVKISLLGRMKNLKENRIEMWNRKCVFVLLLLVIHFSKVSAQVEDYAISEPERALYAISSLRCHIQQLNDNESNELTIPFELEDIDLLWEEARHPEYDSLLQQAKYFYDRSALDDAQSHLDYVWDRLLDYPNFDKNPFINNNMKKEMAPHLLSHKHPVKPILDRIFAGSRVTSSVDTLMQAGFQILYIKDTSFIIVAKHPQLKNYLLKIYPDSENRTRKNQPSWKWLLNRCIGAENIRKLIKKKKIKHFTVADKWLYPLPPISPRGMQHPVILLVTDMKIVNEEETTKAWKTKITAQHLDELYTILSYGYGSSFCQ